MESIKDKIEDYISKNKMRRTPERNALIEHINFMKEFNVQQLMLFAKSKGISKASVYFFIELLVKIGIVKIQERYVWNKEENKLNL